MKKITYILILLVFVSFSCNDEFLDQVPDDRLTYEETFSKRNLVDQYLANVYSFIPNEYAQRYTTTEHSGPWTGGSDEAEYVWSFSASNSVNIGDYNASTQFISTLWSNFYRAIRSATNFMNSVDQCEDCSDLIIAQYKAEARVLRAFFYYNLIRTWGPVNLMGDEPVAPDADLTALDIERSTMDACVAYIVSELDKGAAELAETSFTGSNAGRMSRPFALAIKEKVLLFAASPLFNGNTDYADMVNSQGEQLISQSVDVSKWKAAADAAKAFMDEYVPSVYSLYRENDEAGNLDPYLSTRNAVLEDWNPEIIYARPRGAIYYYYDVTPYHSGSGDANVRGAGGLGATQEIVDAYFTANGRSIDDPMSGYKTSGFSDFQAPYDFQTRETFNQWVNREPRFYVGITYNNSLWIYRGAGNIITETWYEGNSGKQVGGNDYSPTGYIVRKGMHDDIRSNQNYTIPMMRLAEIYLDYAEALNEYDPGNPDILIYLNRIRDRAGIPEYGSEDLEAPGTQAEMREAIHKERRVELAFESIRFFDARRWLIATEAFDGDMHGMDINATPESEFYNVVAFENRTFNLRHNLWPIPQDEIDSNPLLIQNSGW
ncbi:RagB/SusD family nutrient uptake outer membrane protein [Fulvivirga ligni]|uniref:RagB/SusD family nutrient uptake outer membrane protein n=1 Tax=Fulvivirga ligni TaxID=2904246 RepID=UPI001F40740F|nr:RagB/SusD family nutrient uptake outer membrane protein [Fulvivirga ligni]UII19991.1 RagB/SusD family nutrient uptake outer membrane protein [Fulvivirga ligni]